MIHKLMVALVLLGVGFGVLHLTIGWENFARGTEADRGTEPIEAAADAKRGVVVGGASSSTGSAITARVGGAIEVQRRTARQLKNGDTRFLPIYKLTAEDSEMLEDDLMRLETVRVEFFRIDDKAGEPSSALIGTLDASEALVQVGRDENGNASIQEDRDMNLSDVVFRTNPASAVGELELEVAVLRARSTAEGIVFQTPDPDLPFNLRMGGDEPMTLEGHTSRITSLAYRPDGLRIASGSHGKVVRIWDTRTGRAIRDLVGHDQEVTCVAYSPDGTSLASGSLDQTIRIWDPDGGGLRIDPINMGGPSFTETSIPETSS